MKIKFIKVLSLASVLVLTSCSCSNYSNKSLESMSLIELNEYNSDLKDQNESLKTSYDELLDISGNKSKEEIIELINEVNNEVIKSNVMITNESKAFFHTTSISSGSGTIIKEDATSYYVLTNNHVIYSLGNRSSYYIYDYLNNEYNGQVLFNDPDYDMAVLKFTKTDIKLRVTSLASEDASVSDNVIAIGQPKGQRNAITFGEVLQYAKVNCSDCDEQESNISYDCVFYSAITTNGNSGGMLINYNYQLVGVVTYGMTNAKGEYVYGAGSPVSKVKEFFLNNEFEVGDSNETL